MDASSEGLTHPQISKVEFIHLLTQAFEEKKGFAAGKAGFSEQALLRYTLIRMHPDSLKKRAYEAFLKYHCDYMTGVFPSTPEFLNAFSEFFLENVKGINVLGLMEGKNEFQLMKSLTIEAKLTHFQSMEPDRSAPEQASLCYLPLFGDKKILLISPYAEFIASRAKADIYDSVWSTSGKKWFNPSGIEYLNIPYSYITATDTHSLYRDSIALYQTICEQIAEYEFDVALIGAGALGIPLANHIKSLGKIGISLGGHLQIIFGVAGARWRRDPEWQKYINPSWVDVPSSFQPMDKDDLTDQGAYW
jgi:hypothetical protein